MTLKTCTRLLLLTTLSKTKKTTNKLYKDSPTTLLTTALTLLKTSESLEVTKKKSLLSRLKIKKTLNSSLTIYMRSLLPSLKRKRPYFTYSILWLQRKKKKAVRSSFQTSHSLLSFMILRRACRRWGLFKHLNLSHLLVKNSKNFLLLLQQMDLLKTSNPPPS